MNTESQAADQVVMIALHGAEIVLRLTGDAVKNALPLIAALLKEEKTAGKTRLVNLLKDSRDVQITDIKAEDYRRFKKEADRMKLLYSPVKDNANGKVWILAGSGELGRLNHIRQQMGYGAINLTEYAKKNESRDTPQQSYSDGQEKSSGQWKKSGQEQKETPPKQKKEQMPQKESVKAKLDANKELLAKQAAKVPERGRAVPSKGRG